ncbi:MAG: alpha/beta fold hydrolase [Rhodospirillaceae bacterium]
MTQAVIQRAYANAGDGQIHYRQAGPDARSPLLLIHPSPSSSFVYEPFMAEMGRDRMVIAPDLPGHGMSHIPAAAPQIAEYASALLALEATLGLGLFDIMGYHTGGLIAAEMARQQPAAVRKIVMISGLSFTEEERARLGASVPTRSVDDRASVFGQQWLNFKTHFWRMGNDDTRTWNLYLEAQRNPHTATWGQQAAAGYDLAAVLPELSQPVLILNPEDDLRAHTNRVAPLVKNGRVHDLPGWTHGFIDSKVDETAKIVRTFLDN